MIPVTQALLERAFRQSLERRGFSPEGRSTAEGAPPAGAGDRCVFVVLREFSLATFASGTLDFVAKLSGAELEAWYASFTRAVFLFGNPQKLASFAFTHGAPDGSVAWLGPVVSGSCRNLRYLLKAVSAPRPAPASLPPHFEHAPRDVAPSGRRARITIGVAGLSLTEYLIHLGHALAETYVVGRLAPGDAVRLEHVEAIECLDENYFYARALAPAGQGHDGALALHAYAHWDHAG